MSFSAGPSRLPIPRNLTGSRPGLIDPTQPARILREKGSTLLFASFDPLAATGVPRSRKPRVPDFETPPKRIVIETPPLGSAGGSRWRFVPRARRAHGVENEGVWPRKVILCDEPVVLSEDQWDIYKLDPAYDCYIPAPPALTMIRRKDPHEAHVHTHSHAGVPSGNSRKRRRSTPGDVDEQPPGLSKRFRAVVSLVTDEEGTEIEDISQSDEEEDEVEDIVVEEFPYKVPKRADRRQQRRKEREEKTRERREKLKAKMNSSSQHNRPTTPEIVDLTMEDNTPPDLSPPPNGTGPYATKRKVFSGPDSPEQNSPNHETQYKSNKRVRTQSPEHSHNVPNRKPSERERRRRAQNQQTSQEYRNGHREPIWAGIFAQSPWATPPSSQTSQAPPSTDDAHNTEEAAPESEPIDEDAEHRAAIEESRRKLAELEKDRPLWEQEARKREQQQRAEEQARRAREEAERRRAAEAAAREEQRRRHAAAAAAQAEERAQAERIRAEREREERRRRERERWSYGPWTATRAIERYKVLCEAFDVAKFTKENPVEFETVPWPVLHSPVTLRVEDIDWASVEAFFEAARRHLRAQDYKVFVEKSHKRFHPDRWRARGVLKSLEDEELRGNLEVAANTVAQALTPIWREMRG
ncbi:hypothetical protein BD311DRAFT_735987 [Dichomitus squalens]|uniref:Uncharacterized protein n=1 Tax=Dichomitus squalens TaxID=114155 RepID=A0A4Q9N051_9APHY|nr:hypothetical protein BD311DRAFT_735987 [Dichomitus squalens]